MTTYVKGDKVANATSYKLFEGDTEIAEASEINFNVSELIKAEGEHTLHVKAYADGYSPSDASNTVKYTVSAGGGTGETEGDVDDGGDTGDTNVAYTLAQGAWIADGTLYSATNRVATTEKIKGKFYVKVKDGYAIRAAYSYAAATGSGTLDLATNTTTTEFTSTDANKYYGLTFTYSGSNSDNAISPTADIIEEWYYVN